MSHHISPSEVIAARRGASEPFDDDWVHQIRAKREPGERCPTRVRQERVETFELTRGAQGRDDAEARSPHGSTQGDERGIDPRRPTFGVHVVGQRRQNARKQRGDGRGTPGFDRCAVEVRRHRRVRDHPFVDKTKRHPDQMSRDSRVGLAVGVVAVVPPRFTEHVATQVVVYHQPKLKETRVRVRKVHAKQAKILLADPRNAH